MAYANIIVDISHEAVDRPFTYIIPTELADSCRPGSRVMIPFGQGNKLRQGIIVDIVNNPDVPIGRLKEIDSIVLSQDATDSYMIELASYIKQRYGSTMIDALKTVLPAKKSYRRKKAATETADKPLDNGNTGRTVEADIALNTDQAAIVNDFISEYDS